MTKKRIVAKTTVNDGWVQPKVRKKRKPMTEEQRAAASERLAIARAAKAPAKNLNICSEVLNLPDEHTLSAKKVRAWIKTQKELISSYRQEVRRDVKGSIARLANSEGFKTGHFIGEIGFVNETIKSILYRTMGYKHDMTDLIRLTMKTNPIGEDPWPPTFDHELVNEIVSKNNNDDSKDEPK